MVLSRSWVGDINTDYCTCGEAGNDYGQGCHTDLTKASLIRRIVRIKVDKLPWSQAYNVLHVDNELKV
jgi:hypothetical protein